MSFPINMEKMKGSKLSRKPGKFEML